MHEKGGPEVPLSHRLNDDKFFIIFDKLPIPASLLKIPGFTYAEVNASWCEFYGFTKEEAIGRTPTELKIIDQVILDRQKEIVESVGLVNNLEFTVTIRSGERKFVDASIVRFAAGDELFIIIMLVDITHQRKIEQEMQERRMLEKQLIQAQKMEAVGRLAGGVAHDFNNMLGLIIGYAEMGMYKIAAGEIPEEELGIILDAGKRSSEITRQLLGFARIQPINPKVLKLNATVEEILRMIQRIIGEHIDLVWLPGENLWPVNIDPSQIDQILANLCVNSKDAITGTGRIIIETKNVTLDEIYCACHEGFVPGDFVMLSISDNGCGMSNEILEHIFEPFYTTKDKGEGTGLGLSTVYGIVKQNEGFVNVYSELGEGTTANIYIPRYTGEPEREEAGEEEKEQPVSGKGVTLLLVEDEVTLLELGKRMLEDLEYTVLCAGKPEEAIRLAREKDAGIDLLVTDVIMPEMNGRELSERIRSIHPQIKCLFMSGYTSDAIAQHGVLEDHVHFISKPFSRPTLAIKIQEALRD